MTLEPGAREGSVTRHRRRTIPLFAALDTARARSVACRCTYACLIPRGVRPLISVGRLHLDSEEVHAVATEFTIGDKAVYPSQGVAEVIGIEKKEVYGKVQRFY